MDLNSMDDDFNRRRPQQNMCYVACHLAAVVQFSVLTILLQIYIKMDMNIENFAWFVEGMVSMLVFNGIMEQL